MIQLRPHAPAWLPTQAHTMIFVSMDERTQIALFPLPNVVHFPRTHLRLHIFEPRYRRLVKDLTKREELDRLIGMVLLKSALGTVGPSGIYSAGTAGRLVEVKPLPNGRSNIVLRGEFRFEVVEEVATQPYRQAIVRRIEEPSLNPADPALKAVRDEIVKLSQHIAKEVGKNFPLEGTSLKKLRDDLSFEELVNALAAHLDVPVLRKLDLLTHNLPERALEVLSILRSRQKVLDFLRPYRELASDPRWN